jgi:hypothetical protein
MPGQIDGEKLRPPAERAAGFAFSTRGRKRKDVDRKPSGKPRYVETDYGTAYGAMQRLSRLSPKAAVDALDVFTELARLTGRCSADLSNAERTKISNALDYSAKLARQQRDGRSSYPLGILYQQGAVSGREHYAGKRYAALFVAAVRQIGVPSILADLSGRGAVSFYRGSDDGSVGRPDLEIAYRQAREQITAEGIRIVRIVDEVVVYEEGQPALGSPRLRMLTTGLTKLADHFEIVDEQRRKLG